MKDIMEKCDICIYGFQKLNVVNQNSKAISVDAGHKATLFYFTNKIKKW